MEQTLQPRTFGFITGLGVGAGIFYYKALVDAHLARGLSARLLMVHADVRRVMGLATAGETQQLAEYLASLLQQLALGGAEVASVPAFAPQVCARELAVMSPLPLISLVDAIISEVQRRRYRRVALFGARVTMETRMFGSLEGVDVVMPMAEELDTIAGIYGRVVEQARASNEDHEVLSKLAHALIDREGLDGVILAGTDLAFVFNPENTDFPYLDGARIHIDAIMREIAPLSVTA
jgi:aspartate racemase